MPRGLSPSSHKGSKPSVRDGRLRQRAIKRQRGATRAIHFKETASVMERTIWKLEFIDKHKQPTGPFEVTQLVNSFLGALAHPWEELQAEFKRRTIEEAEKNGWPKVSKDSPEDMDPKHLGDLLRLMRHGIAHGICEAQPREPHGRT
jgi:hypothetical protein